MFTPRRSQRNRVVLPATLDVPTDGGDTWSLAAWTLDLSQEGAGVFTADELPVGLTLWIVVVEGPPGGPSRVRRWPGRVVNIRDGEEGYRLGIAFDDGGPALSLRVPRPDGRAVVFRVDPPWGEPDQAAEEPAPAAVEGPRDEPPAPRPWRLFAAVAALGLAIDQLTKALAFAQAGGAGPASRSAPGWLAADATVKDYGQTGGWALGLPMERQALAILALAVAAAAFRLVLRGRRCWRPVAAAGWGLLASGLLSNAADRLALGYVRDFLRTRLWPAWAFNVADLLAIAGVLMLAGAWAFARKPGAGRGTCSEPSGAVRGGVPVA